MKLLYLHTPINSGTFSIGVVGTVAGGWAAYMYISDKYAMWIGDFIALEVLGIGCFAAFLYVLYRQIIQGYRIGIYSEAVVVQKKNKIQTINAEDITLVNIGVRDFVIEYTQGGVKKSLTFSVLISKKAARSAMMALSGEVERIRSLNEKEKEEDLDI